MTLILKGLPQVSQDGASFWFTDKTGEYAVTTNEGGWGAPNFELSQSALLLFTYWKSNPKQLLTPIGGAVKFNGGATNADETAFQMEYLKDGVTEFNILRLMVTGDDANSIDSTPIVFAEGDVFYNQNDFLVKQIQSAVAVELDITDPDVLDTLLGNSSVVELLCHDVYFKDLAVEKNARYTRQVDARYKNDTAQILRMRNDQTDITLGTSAAAYQFSYGLEIEAQKTIESLLDQFNLN